MKVKACLSRICSVVAFAAWLFVVPAFFISSSLCAGEQERVIHGAMEGPFIKGLQQGWAESFWGKNDVVFSPGPPHSGKSSQQVTCNSYEDGAAQFYYPLVIRQGKTYKLRLWMRAEGNVGAVKVGLRHRSAPYTMHLSTSFEPGTQWEEFHFEGTSIQSDESVGLFIWFQPEGGGTVWVDDVSLVEGEPAAVLPLPTSNVVPNGSFEVAWQRDWRSRRVRPFCDASQPFHGQRSLRWELDGQNEQLASRIIEFGSQGAPFTLSLAARAEGKATVVAELRPGIQAEDGNPLLQLHAQPGVDWKVFTATGAVRPSSNGGYWLSVDVRAEGKATVWLDAIRLQPGEAKAPFAPCRMIEASLESRAIAHIYKTGEPVELTLRAFNHQSQDAHRALVCRVTDYWRRPVAEIPLQVDLRPSVATEAPVRIPLATTGVFLAELHDGDEVLSELAFSVLPPSSQVPAEKSVIGGHFRLDPFHLQVAQAMGVHWTRIHDCETITHWRTVEPQKGRFVWFDDKVRLAREQGIQILGEFLNVPDWASSRPAGGDAWRGPYPPRDNQEFASYVRAVVEHYRHDIHYWEIWNEPWSDFWRGTAEQYAAFANLAAVETRRADPTARLVAPSIAPMDGQWMDRASAAGALNGVDIFSYHGYELLLPKVYDRLTRWASVGRSSPRPVWNTETGPMSRTFYRRIPDKFVDRETNEEVATPCAPYDIATEHAVKLFVLAMAGKVERYFQYSSVYEESLLPRLGGMNIFEYDASLRPMAVAYAIAGSLLDGTHGEGWIDVPGNVLASLLTDEKRSIAVLWSSLGRTRHCLMVPLRANLVQVRDIMGNPLAFASKTDGMEVVVGGEPVYLITSIANAKLLREALSQTKAIHD